MKDLAAGKPKLSSNLETLLSELIVWIAAYSTTSIGTQIAACAQFSLGSAPNQQKQVESVPAGDHSSTAAKNLETL